VSECTRFLDTLGGVLLLRHISRRTRFMTRRAQDAQKRGGTCRVLLRQGGAGVHMFGRPDKPDRPASRDRPAPPAAASATRSAAPRGLISPLLPSLPCSVLLGRCVPLHPTSSSPPCLCARRRRRRSRRKNRFSRVTISRRHGRHPPTALPPRFGHTSEGPSRASRPSFSVVRAHELISLLGPLDTS
jgi:hypothetical protein